MIYFIDVSFILACFFFMIVSVVTLSPSELYSLMRQGSARRLDEVSIWLCWFIRFSVCVRGDGKEKDSDVLG